MLQTEYAEKKLKEASVELHLKNLGKPNMRKKIIDLLW